MTRQTGFPVITAEALADLRRRIGVPVRRPEPYIETATRDAVRHWTAGIGDRNPFWLDAGVAPPTILFAMDRIVSGYVGGLPGIHAMYGGTDFRWQRPIRIGDAIVGDSVLLDLVEKPSQFARRAIQQIYRTTFRNQTRDIVCEADSWCFRTERDTARERGKYSAVEPPRYTEREIDAIAAAYRKEEVRGRTPRYWNDVTVGAALPEVVKGPPDGDVRHRVRAGVGEPLRARPRARLRDVRASPALGIPNASGVPEPPERVHWDEAMAQAVGVPGAYDYGPERVAWLGHLVTNWMGDAGFLRRLNARVLRHNLIGDTTWCRGTVTGKEPGGVVHLALRADNQRRETTASGSATVVLPERSAAS